MMWMRWNCRIGPHQRLREVAVSQWGISDDGVNVNNFTRGVQVSIISKRKLLNGEQHSLSLRKSLWGANTKRPISFSVQTQFIYRAWKHLTTLLFVKVVLTTRTWFEQSLQEHHAISHKSAISLRSHLVVR